MTKRTHQPPSRRRYQASHPSIGVHVDLETRAKLVELRDRSGLSFGKLVQQALGVLDMDVIAVQSHGREQGIAEGHRRGYVEGRQAGQAEAVSAYRITVPCDSCSGGINIRSGSKAHEAVVRILQEQGWRHRQCPE